MSELRPPTPEEIERIKRLKLEPTWSLEDMAWLMELSKVIVWDVQLEHRGNQEGT